MNINNSPLTLDELCTRVIACDRNYFGSIEIPDSVSTIGWGAFYDCSRLIEITLPKKLKIIRTQTFAQCISIEKIVMPIVLIKIMYFDTIDLKNIRFFADKKTESNRIRYGFYLFSVLANIEFVAKFYLCTKIQKK